MCYQPKKSEGAAVFAWQSLKIGLQAYRVSRRLQDHESVERCDAAIAAHVPARVVWAAADCDLERYHGVCGGDRRRLLRGRGAWGWLDLEWVERNFSFIAIIDACAMSRGCRLFCI